MAKNCLQVAFVGLVLLFLYLPILLLAVYSFDATDMIGRFEGFSLTHYAALFSDQKVLGMIGNTFLLAFLAAALSTVLGTAGALGMFYCKKRMKAAIHAVSQIPVINAEIVTALALAITFVAAGLGKSYFTLLIGHMVICTPFVVLSVLPKLKQMDNSLYEAALDLGASPAKALWKVVLPQIIPGVISGFMLAVTLSLDDYIVTVYTRPTGFETISTYVFNATMKGNAHTAVTLSSFWALTTIIFVVIVLFVVISNLASMRKKEASK
ncbi:MAG: ABC transporter permease [Clostridia bacterium]|nr:ABC transporter permease [Clostridia bacterium]